MLTYRYKLYSSKRNCKIDAMLREACFVWNHTLALQKRYYSLTGRYCSCARMKSHFASRISRCRLHSQTVHEILERLDAAYKRFFQHLAVRPPTFKRAEQFRSIVYKQGGFKLNSNVLVLNSIKQHFQFSYSRPWEGTVKQIQVKRTTLGELYFVTDATSQPRRKSHDGASVGMDFGLKTYLTLSNGRRIENPLFLRQGLNELCRAYDMLCVEDLQLTGMSRLWGRKMADLAFGSFVQKLEHTASKYGCEVRKVDMYYPSSRTCGCCGYVYEHLDLRDRHWTCPQCGATLDRDVNAAMNIMRQGIVSSGSPRKTKVTLRKGR